MLLTNFSEIIYQLSNDINELERLNSSDTPDFVEAMNTQCRIDDSLTSLSIFFQRCDKLQKTFEAIREYYVNEVVKKEKNKKTTGE